MERPSESGRAVDPVDDSKLTDFRPAEKLGQPGACPFINRRYHELIEAGTTWLSVALARRTLAP
jgi:hypothetical protein